MIRVGPGNHGSDSASSTRVRQLMRVCVQGEQGVVELLQLLEEELRLAMALSGNSNTWLVSAAANEGSDVIIMALCVYY